MLVASTGGQGDPQEDPPDGGGCSRVGNTEAAFRRVPENTPGADAMAAPKFVELITPSMGTVSNCGMEVEAHGGKLRLELKAVPMSELVHLMRAFVGR